MRPAFAHGWPQQEDAILSQQASKKERNMKRHVLAPCIALPLLLFSHLYPVPSRHILLGATL